MTRPTATTPWPVLGQRVPTWVRPVATQDVDDLLPTWVRSAATHDVDDLLPTWVRPAATTPWPVHGQRLTHVGTAGGDPGR
jgi:hypothetical protein